MKSLKLVIVLFLVGLSFIGCGRRAIIRKYYVLEAQSFIPSERLGIDHPFAYNVDVRNFRVGPAFEQTRIAVRSASHELDYYFYHHWAIRPSTAIADMVFELVDRSGLFQQCFRGYSYRPDFLISGHVYSLERVRDESGDAAHLNVLVELVDVKSEQSVVRHEFDRTVKLTTGGSMNEFARIISDIMLQETEQFIHRATDFLQSGQQ
jgi:ABC-type uncharacterized transport system auxiliary subunit